MIQAQCVMCYAATLVCDVCVMYVYVMLICGVCVMGAVYVSVLVHNP